MPTDTPDTSRAALEALADDADRWLRYWGWFNPSLAGSSKGDLLASIARYAPTLRALAARAEPPADVAALVEEARQYAGKATRSADAYREARLRFEAETHASASDLVNRLAAALTAQAERADRAEEARRIAALEIAGKHLAVKLAEVYRAANANLSDCQALRDWLSLMPARALAAKLKGETE